MLDLIGSSEFGDWLLAELSDAAELSNHADAGLSHAARLRLDTLEMAKKVLLEFLLLQQKMMETASEAREMGRLPSHHPSAPVTQGPPCTG
jgi:hypothetical protein